MNNTYYEQFHNPNKRWRNFWQRLGTAQKEDNQLFLGEILKSPGLCCQDDDDIVTSETVKRVSSSQILTTTDDITWQTLWYIYINTNFEIVF